MVDDGVAFASADCDRHDLVGEAARCLRSRGPLMGPHRELVLFLAGDRVVPAEVLRGLDHPARYRMVLPARSHPSPRQSVMQHDTRAAPGPPPHGRGVEGRVRHRLRATGQHDLACAGLHLHRRVEHGLQSRPAAVVDLQTGRRHRQAGIERRDPADRGGVHRRVAVAQHDVVDDLRWYPGPLQGCRDDRRGQRRRRYVAQRPAEAPDRGPQRLADHRVAHAFLPWN